METWDHELLLEQAMASTVDTETASAIEERMSEYLEAVETSTLSTDTRETLTMATKKAFIPRFAAVYHEEQVPDTPETLVRLFMHNSLPLNGQVQLASPSQRQFRSAGLLPSSVPPSSPCPSS